MIERDHESLGSRHIEKKDRFLNQVQAGDILDYNGWGPREGVRDGHELHGAEL